MRKKGKSVKLFYSMFIFLFAPSGAVEPGSHLIISTMERDPTTPGAGRGRQRSSSVSHRGEFIMDGLRAG